jgi:hypothetical protein
MELHFRHQVPAEISSLNRVHSRDPEGSAPPISNRNLRSRLPFVVRAYSVQLRLDKCTSFAYTKSNN